MESQFIRPPDRMPYRVLRHSQPEVPSVTQAEEPREILEHENPVRYADSVKFSRFGEISPAGVFQSPLGHFFES